MKKLVFKESFQKDFSNLLLRDQNRIRKKITLFAEIEVSDVKKLRPAEQNLWRLRSGRIRVIFRFDGEKIILFGVDLRKDIYKSF